MQIGAWGVGLYGGGGQRNQYFVRAHLTKQRQLTFLVLCHIWYSGTRRGSGCKDPITPPLCLSLLGVAVALMEGWWRGSTGGVHSRQTPPFECKASAAANPPRRSPSTALPPPSYYFVGFHSYFWMDRLSRPRISTGDMSSKPGHLRVHPLT